MVRLSNANFINNYPQPVFHFNEYQLRCVKVIVPQTLQRRPLAAHASKFRVSGNTPLRAPDIVASPQTFLGVRHAFLPEERLTNPLRSSTVEATDMGPFILKRKHLDTTPSIHFFYSGCTTQRMIFIFVKIRIPGGTCVDSLFNGFFHF